MKNNQSGFTLVELLAVVVILAVVMLIGVTAVGPLMARARKSSLATEGIAIVKAAQAAYQTAQISTNSLITSTTTACINIRYLYENGFYEKGKTEYTDEHDGYKGSVLIYYSGGKYQYRVWIANNTYYFNGIDINNYNVDSDAVEYSNSYANAAYRCGHDESITESGGVISNGIYCHSSGCSISSSKLELPA